MPSVNKQGTRTPRAGRNHLRTSRAERLEDQRLLRLYSRPLPERDVAIPAELLEDWAIEIIDSGEPASDAEFINDRPGDKVA